jgi:hexosaminidase
VQGYPNNALNPAIPLTYEFLEKVLDEMVELFPSAYIHIGGDEVANGSWLASPLAKKLMEQEGISGTFALQSYFLKRIKDMLTPAAASWPAGTKSPMAAVSPPRTRC